jgi:hypothetical protein
MALCHHQRQAGLVLPGTSLCAIFASTTLLLYRFRQTLPPTQGPLSPFLQHNVLGARLGSFHKVRHSVQSWHLLPYFRILPTTPFLSHMALCYRRCQAGIVLPGRSLCAILHLLPCFCIISVRPSRLHKALCRRSCRHNILSASLGSFYQVYHCVQTWRLLHCFHILSVRPSLLRKDLCRHSCSTTSSVPAWGRFPKYITVSGLCILYITFYSFCQTLPSIQGPLLPLL